MKIFIDFDCTIADSVKAYCNVYNLFYKDHEGFKKADYSRVNRYDLMDQCCLVDHQETIFSHEELFKHLEFMPHAEEIIKKLGNKYELVICSIGTLDNISLKANWIKHNLSFIKNIIFISSAVATNGIRMDKSSVNMENSIFIDDHVENLLSSNAEFKICFGKEYEWNKSWTERRCLNWQEVEKLLL